MENQETDPSKLKEWGYNKDGIQIMWWGGNKGEREKDIGYLVEKNKSDVFSVSSCRHIRLFIWPTPLLEVLH